MIVTVTLNPSLDEWIELPALRLGALNRADGFSRYPGGKGINVSRVVHELGESTRAFGFAGGEDGLILRELLNRLNIPHTLVPIPGSTRNNYKIRTRHPRALTELNTAGPSVPAAALRRLERALIRGLRGVPAVVLSGSVPPGVPATIYRRWILALRRLGLRAVLDASGLALRHGLSARPWLIKPNRAEAEALLDRRIRRPVDAVRAARQLVARGAELAVLSLGQDGAVLAAGHPAACWFARPPKVAVDSAVGAGDSLVGGFLIGWRRTRSIVEGLRWGVASGTATAMTRGTELCHRRDVVRLVRRVVIKPVG